MFHALIELQGFNIPFTDGQARKPIVYIHTHTMHLCSITTQLAYPIQILNE